MKIGANLLTEVELLVKKNTKYTGKIGIYLTRINLTITITSKEKEIRSVKISNTLSRYSLTHIPSK